MKHEPPDDWIGPRTQYVMEAYASIGDPPTVRGVLRLVGVVFRLGVLCNHTVCKLRRHPWMGFEVTHPSFGTVESCGCGARTRTVY